MSKCIKRIAASILALSIGASVFAGCSSSKSSASGASGIPEQIADDAPWYNLTRIDVTDGADESMFIYRTKSFVGVVNDKVVYNISSSYQPDENGESKSEHQLMAFDLEGNLVSEVSLADAFKERDLGSEIYVSSVSKEGSEICIVATVYDEDYNYLGNYRAVWDVETGELGEITEYSNADFQDALGDNAPLRSFNVGGYKLDLYITWSEQYECYLVVTDGNGSQSLISVREAMPSLNLENLYDMPAALEKGEGKALLCFDVMGSPVYVDFDLNTHAMSESPVDYSWLNTSLGDIRNIEGTGSVIINGEGIYSIDLGSNTTEEIFSYSNTNVNRYVAEDLYPISISEDQVVMTGIIYEPCAMSVIGSDDAVIYVFDKADTNPNAGKEVITIASVGGYSYALCDAVCRFNEENSEYFAEFDTRYDIAEFLNDKMAYYDSDSLRDLTDNVCADLGNQLSVDLLAGDGPDIIIGAASYSQINNPDYLIDLSDYINTNLPASDYFTNIIDSSKTGDAVYQIPVSFRIAGIAASESSIEPGQKGFTFDEYRRFVAESCNGTDPLNYGKLGFFLTVMNSMMDIMTDDNGRVSFDNDAFRTLAEFTEENIFEPREDEDNYYDFYDEAEAFEVMINDIYTYHRRVLENSKVVMGYPSYDGRGPQIVGRSSIGISTQSDNIDGCMDFVSMVMSYDCQKLFGYEFGLPVNRAAFKAIGEEYVEGYNESVDRKLAIYTPEELNMMGESSTYADETLVNDFEALADSLTGETFNVDAPVDAIISEEIPGYFEGQKSLDEVISVIEDRTSSVINERF